MSSPNRRGTGLVLMHAVGNVLLGIAVGLLTYYVATDVAGMIRQSRMRDELKPLGPVAAEDPSTALAEGDEGQFDWTGWAEEDSAYWLALADAGAFGRLVIDKIGLDVTVVKGHARANLKNGPGWVDYTDLPSETGNTGISGHRTTYGAPFRHLDQLSPGDTIDLYSPYRRYRYEVLSVFQVTPDQTEVFDATGEPRLTLTACHPPYSARYRLVVSAELVDVRRFETPPHLDQ